ncbi:MBL fold metallo-hydrolase [Halococcus sediminicola]|uniref:MBL fold metallo-hydrolase n=1 Tax=Halococcus sediminicola TaxID=1264579 RepID=UPI00067956A1|nr:MBL fold metallo-hydrolase [Halococcus sediminicola]
MAQRERAVPVHRIEFDVDWPPGHAASYLIDCERPTLVDAGMPGADCETRLREALADIDYEPADIENLVLTHPHVDHIGQTNTVLAAADPTVYAPVGVRERFARDANDLAAVVRENATRAGLAGDERERAIDMAVESLERNRDLLPPAAVDVWIEGGETYEVGGTPVEALHTPGHQADHCCFSVALGDERALVAGDMAIEPFRPVTLHTGLDRGVEEAIGMFYGALDRLASLDPDRVYPGHGPVHTDFEHTIERDRRSLDRLLDRTVEALDEPRTAADIADQRTGANDTTYILPETVAALAHLESVDRIEAELDDGVVRYHTR